MIRPTLALAAIALLLVPAGSAFAQADPLANCKYYMKTAQDYEQGLPHCLEAIEKYPEDPEARFYGGWCLAESGDYDQAWISFSWLIERMEDEDGDVRKYAKKADDLTKRYYSGHFNRGVELLKAEDMQEAMNEFLLASKINPLNTDAMLNLGYAQVQLEDLDGALASFESAISANPESEDAYHYYWDALSRKIQRVREQGAYADTVVAEDGTEQIVLVTPEKTLADLNPKLRSTLEMILERNPKDPDAHLQMADLYYAEGKNDEALEHVKLAIAAAPEAVVDLFNVAVGFYQTDDYGPAIQALNTVIDNVHDQDDELWERSRWVLGLCYLYEGDSTGNQESFMKSLGVFEELIAYDDGQMDYYIKAGTAASKAGESDKASEYILKWEEMKEAEVVGE